MIKKNEFILKAINQAQLIIQLDELATSKSDRT